MKSFKHLPNPRIRIQAVTEILKTVRELPRCTVSPIDKQQVYIWVNADQPVLAFCPKCHNEHFIKESQLKAGQGHSHYYICINGHTISKFDLIISRVKVKI